MTEKVDLKKVDLEKLEGDTEATEEDTEATQEDTEATEEVEAPERGSLEEVREQTEVPRSSSKLPLPLPPRSA